MEPWNWTKFWSGLNIFNPATRGKMIINIIITLVVFAICGFVLWKVFIAKTHTNVTNAPAATTIANVNQPKLSFWGCNNIKVMEYYKAKETK